MRNTMEKTRGMYKRKFSSLITAFEYYQNMNQKMLFDWKSAVSSEVSDIIVVPNKGKLKCQAARIWSRFIHLRTGAMRNRAEVGSQRHGRLKRRVGKPEILTPPPPSCLPPHPLQQSNDSVSICDKLCHWKTANVTVNFVTLQNHSLLYDFRETKIKQSFLTTNIRF